MNQYRQQAQTIIKQMSSEQKAQFVSGADFWHLEALPDLGVKQAMVSDGPSGLRKQDESADHLGINDSIKAVAFPTGSALAATFDQGLAEELGHRLGKEAQAVDLSVVLGPAINIKRSPLAGRNFEYLSEDPYLAGKMGAAYIKGVQAEGVGTSVKHYAANNQENLRMSSSSNMDERTLREIYLAPFELAIKEGKPDTVMNSYNKVNGVYTSENKYLLTDILRKEWGFEGYVMTDWGAESDRIKALQAGQDLEMPGDGHANTKLILAALEKGELDIADLDRAMENILTMTLREQAESRTEEFDYEGDHAFSQKVAEESMVLLKNENHILPLNDQESVAFIGDFAAKPRFQGGGSSHVNAFKLVSVLDAVADKENVTYLPGFERDSDEDNPEMLAQALKLAQKVDKVVVFAGLPDRYESEGYDRSHLHLPQNQINLIERLAAINENLIVVLHNGSVVELPFKDKVKGIFEAYLNGQAGGQAEVNLLFGKVNPSGKLAETMPIKLADNPSYLTFGMEDAEYNEGVFVGYRYYDKKQMRVNYPFGHGLSYTTFAYRDLTLSQIEMTDTDQVMVSVKVKNTGKVFGKEVVQLYVHDQTKVVMRPEKELKGFAKVALEPGEEKEVCFQLDKRSLAWYSEALHDWYAASGQYDIMVGASSRDIRLMGTINYQTKVLLPFTVGMDTPLQKLLADPRTATQTKVIVAKMDAFFGADSSQDEEDKAVSDEMANAMFISMPLRALVSMGIFESEEMKDIQQKLQAQIDK